MFELAAPLTFTAQHGSCPACRNVFSSIKPPSDSDNESSDGDYIPGDDEDEDEDDAFLDTDGFTEYEFDADEMELDGEFDTDVDEDEDAVVDMSVYLDFDASADIAVWDNAREGVDEGMVNWGLSDGEGSESLSEGDVLNLSAVLENVPVQTDDAAVFDDDSVEEASVSVLEDDTAESK
ncbi:hypothetical protein A0H81_03716 [Grifola frondosa]|uniref:Uncharacterized protein n=1 Tax=Grifola frondosa TaxID=5627 RepID=A0A1C7MJL4_GRIFR|nr:hypothetical protein A0H81_03716 [Grifola frondosa]